MKMKMESDFHMVKGDGETSYAKNSRMQRRAILVTKTILEKAIRGVCTDLHPQSMVIADLGCASTPNTLLFVSEAITTVCENRSNNSTVEACPMELQFFLNDLPSNDFNYIFQSLEKSKQSIAQDCAHRGLQPPPHYIAGVPGSFYARLFSCNSVHVFHSSFSLMWLSQIPERLDGSMNEGNIHIATTTSPLVAKLYRDQFETDFSQFLQMRCSELVPGGHMVLTVLGRSSDEVVTAAGWTTALELLAQGLCTLAAEGRVDKEKINSFNIPFYCPSTDELKRLVKQSELLTINDIQLVETSWNPLDDDSEQAKDGGAEAAGQSISSTLRAVLESLVVNHFGDSIVDELFAALARNVTRHIESVVEKTTITIISLSLQRNAFVISNEF